jgi:hypothetical protein
MFYGCFLLFKFDIFDWNRYSFQVKQTWCLFWDVWPIDFYCSAIYYWVSRSAFYWKYEVYICLPIISLLKHFFLIRSTFDGYLSYSCNGRSYSILKAMTLAICSDFSTIMEIENGLNFSVDLSAWFLFFDETILNFTYN